MLTQYNIIYNTIGIDGTYYAMQNINTRLITVCV